MTQKIRLFGARPRKMYNEYDCKFKMRVSTEEAQWYLHMRKRSNAYTYVPTNT